KRSAAARLSPARPSCQNPRLAQTTATAASSTTASHGRGRVPGSGRRALEWSGSRIITPRRAPLVRRVVAGTLVRPAAAKLGCNTAGQDDEERSIGLDRDRIVR